MPHVFYYNFPEYKFLNFFPCVYYGHVSISDMERRPHRFHRKVMTLALYLSFL